MMDNRESRVMRAAGEAAIRSLLEVADRYHPENPTEAERWAADVIAEMIVVGVTRQLGFGSCVLSPPRVEI